MARSLSIIMSLFLISSCVTSWNYNSKEPFSKYVNAEMTILRDSYLRKVGENEFSRSKLEVSTRYSVEDDIVVTIPKGEKVHIYKVTQYLQHAVNGGEYVIAFGRYTSPKGQSYRFQFVWGVSGNLYLAPWVESKYSQGEYW